jgi:hypothetical protein
VQADVGAYGERGSPYLLTGADPIMALYASALIFHTPSKGGGERLRVFSMAPQAIRPETLDTGSLSLPALDLPRPQNAFERLERPPDFRVEPGLVPACFLV